MAYADLEKKRIEVIKLYEMNFPIEGILKNIGISRRGYFKIIKNFKERGETIRKPGSGRKSLLNDDQKRKILKKIETDNKVLAKKISAELRETEKIEVSRRSVSHFLEYSGLKALVPAFKPMLTKKHKIKRFEEVKKWSLWSVTRFQ